MNICSVFIDTFMYEINTMKGAILISWSYRQVVVDRMIVVCVSISVFQLIFVTGKIKLKFSKIRTTFRVFRIHFYSNLLELQILNFWYLHLNLLKISKKLKFSSPIDLFFSVTTRTTILRIKIFHQSESSFQLVTSVHPLQYFTLSDETTLQ